MLFLRRLSITLCALFLTASLSVSAFAGDTVYLINGVAKAPSSTSEAGGILRPRGSADIERDEKGADRSRRRLGIANVTQAMRKAEPAYYGAKQSRKANAPEAVPLPDKPLTPQQLVEKYQISIIDKNGYLTGRYGQQAVTIIDMELEAWSPDFVRQLVEQYREKGFFFVLNIYYPDVGDSFKGATELDANTICVNLVIPTEDHPGGIEFGTVVHEFGHTVFMYLEKVMGKNNLYRQWSAFNEPFQYGSRAKGRIYAFVSQYGSQYYYEDPATIVEACAEAPEVVGKRLLNKDYARLYNKIVFLEECIENKIGTPGVIFKNVWAAME